MPRIFFGKVPLLLEKGAYLCLLESLFVMKKSVTVAALVSTYNWPEALRLCLSALFRQTRLPDEIMVADDGSTTETVALLEQMKRESPVPLHHLWHEDKGFRKTIILNRAIAAIRSDYVLQLDGDVIPDLHFVADHLELAERGYFVCGSRVKLTEAVTRKAIARGRFRASPFDLPLPFVLNSFRSRFLRHLLAERYARKIDHLRGCNMAFWREDLLRVNGYNEDLLQWGHEDGELAFRLHFAGVKKKALKMGGNVFHLWHKESDRGNERRHLDELDRVKREHLSWCMHGIDQYLARWK